MTDSFNPRTHTGCDHTPGRVELLALMFQSTHPHGVRLELIVLNVVLSSVSIHAPTRGATYGNEPLLGEAQFQSTHPHGVRLALLITYLSFLQFQSTHPHGVRHNSNFSVICSRKFQSTHPHGVRLCTLLALTFGLPFQSTHPHGVRLLQNLNLRLDNQSFNPRTHTGCD